MRQPLFLSLLCLIPALPACSAVAPLPPASSTQGVTLVKLGKVVGVEAGNPAEVTVMFDNGEVRRYEAGSTPAFQLGDNVAVSENRGVIRLSRQ
jgi:hypothetical protein